MRARFFGPDASTAHQTRRLLRRATTSFRSVDLDIRDADGVDRLVGERGHRPRARDPHRGPAVARLGRRRSADRLRRSTRPERSTCSRRRDGTSPTRRSSSRSTNKVYGDRPNALPLVELETRLELPPTHEYFDGIPTSMSIDACLHSLFGASKAAADLLVQEYGRYFEHADGLLPRRLPHRAEPRGRAAARVPLVPDALHRHRRAVHRLRLRREAGARQHPQRRPRPRLRRPSTTIHAPAPSTTSAAGARATARCSRRSSCCEAIAGRELDWALGPEPRVGDHRWWISDLAAFRRDYPELGARVRRSTRSCGRSTSRTHDVWTPAAMKLSVVIPAHDEAGSIVGTVTGIAETPGRARDRLRGTRGRRREHRRDRSTSWSELGARNPRIRCHPLAESPRLRLRRAGRARQVRGRRRRDRHGRRLRRPGRHRRVPPHPRVAGTIARSARGSCAARASTTTRK